jgi:hypothetical protein
MPYVKEEDRRKLDPLILPLVDKVAELSQESEGAFAGLLNYCMTELAVRVLSKRFSALRYWLIATTTGVFHNAAGEFYRRVGHAYEDAQIEKNGDLSSYRELLDK